MGYGLDGVRALHRNAIGDMAPKRHYRVLREGIQESHGDELEANLRLLDTAFRRALC